jgi:aspartate oxidase
MQRNLTRNSCNNLASLGLLECINAAGDVVDTSATSAALGPRPHYRHLFFKKRNKKRKTKKVKTKKVKMKKVKKKLFALKMTENSVYR